MSGSARAWQPSLLDTEALDHATAVLYVVAVVFHGGSAGSTIPSSLFALPDGPACSRLRHRPNGREAVGEHGRGATATDKHFAGRPRATLSLRYARNTTDRCQCRGVCTHCRSTPAAAGAHQGRSAQACRGSTPTSCFADATKDYRGTAQTVCSLTNASGLSHHPLCRSSSRRPSRGRSVIRWSGTIVWPGTGSSSKRFIRVARMITASWMAKVPAMQTRGPTPNGR